MILSVFFAFLYSFALGFFKGRRLALVSLVNATCAAVDPAAQRCSISSFHVRQNDQNIFVFATNSLPCDLLTGFSSMSFWRSSCGDGAPHDGEAMFCLAFYCKLIACCLFLSYSLFFCHDLIVGAFASAGGVRWRQQAWWRWLQFELPCGAWLDLRGFESCLILLYIKRKIESNQV